MKPPQLSAHLRSRTPTHLSMNMLPLSGKLSIVAWSVLEALREIRQSQFDQILAIGGYRHWITIDSLLKRPTAALSEMKSAMMIANASTRISRGVNHTIPVI